MCAIAADTELAPQTRIEAAAVAARLPWRAADGQGRVTDDEIAAKIQEYDVGADEIAAANLLVVAHMAKMIDLFGTRLNVVMAHILGSQLCHMLRDLDEAPFVADTVNRWLDMNAREHDALPLQLRFPEEAEA